MGSKFIDVPAAALLATLSVICEKVTKAGGSCKQGKSGREVTFDVTPPNTPVFLRVYTSLGVGDDSVRDCGKDAVRLTVGSLIDGKYHPLAKSRRIYRTAPKGDHDARVQAFLDRLTQALRDGYKTAKDQPICRVCENPFQIKENKTTGNKFWGCTGYNSKAKCQRTFNYIEEEKSA
jgi:hypothetical protein